MSHLTVARTATLALATMLVLAGCGQETDAEQTTPTASDPSATESSTAETSPASASPSTSTSQAPQEGEGGKLTTLPLYFVGDTPQGQRLFREFTSVPTPDPLAEAVLMITSGDAKDPDYRSLFPAGEFASVQRDVGQDQVTVELTDDAWVTRPAGMNKAQARLATQQLVYTVQGVLQERLPIVVTLGGTPTSLFGIDTAAGLTQKDQIDVLALVNVTTPEQNGVVKGSFRASGVASAFEATVPWEIRSGKTVVLEGFSTAEGWMDKLYPWQSDEIDVSGLKPGSYTFVASTGDASDGEGFGPTIDTKEFEVR